MPRGSVLTRASSRGRIRRERGNYTVLNNLIGQDHVRSQFTEDADASR